MELLIKKVDIDMLATQAAPNLIKTFIKGMCVLVRVCEVYALCTLQEEVRRIVFRKVSANISPIFDKLQKSEFPGTRCFYEEIYALFNKSVNSLNREKIPLKECEIVFVLAKHAVSKFYTLAAVACHFKKQVSITTWIVR